MVLLPKSFQAELFLFFDLVVDIVVIRLIELQRINARLLQKQLKRILIGWIKNKLITEILGFRLRQITTNGGFRYTRLASNVDNPNTFLFEIEN